MKKIIAFSGSNSSQSINGALINYAADQFAGAEVVDLRDYEIPMYGIDLEQTAGIPEGVKQLMNKIMEAEGVLISTPEHNGLMPAFFKNILDWLSRTGVKYLEGRAVVVMSTSPGNGAAKKAAEAVEKIIGYAGATVVGRFNLPGFGQNFADGKIVNEEFEDLFREQVADLRD